MRNNKIKLKSGILKFKQKPEYFSRICIKKPTVKNIIKSISIDLKIWQQLNPNRPLLLECHFGLPDEDSLKRII